MFSLTMERVYMTHQRPSKGVERPFEIGSEEHEHAWQKTCEPKWRAAYGTGGWCRRMAEECQGDCRACHRESEWERLNDE